MTPRSLRLDERNHVEKPFLDQLAGLGWEILDLDNRQLPGDSHRENFTELVMLPVLRERLRVINPWLENDQVEEVVKRLTASFPGTGLLENNRHVLNLLLENTSVSRNRQTGENSPTVHFVWGSCTVNDNVNLNWRLIKAPMFVIDYVIVHELAHLIESNHTPRFWNIVRTQAPMTEKARSWLREQGQLLEQDI